MEAHVVGTRVPRKEGADKVSGRARYVDDLHVEGMLHGVTVRSTVARGRIKDIRFTGDLPWDEITVVTAADIPGDNFVTLIDDDQPVLADGVVNHPEEAVLLLAHADRYLLEEARRHVEIDYEELPAIFTIEEAEAGDVVIWGSDNVIKRFTIDKGDSESVWEREDVHTIVEGTYRTSAQEQLYIECQGMLATASPEAGVTVQGSLQCPYYVHKALGPIFGLPADKVRVVQAVTGGGFGGKEEYPSMIAAHAALLAWKAGRPVKMVYDRAEDMVATTKRHPSRTTHKTALSRDGRILAMDIDFVLDGGAYMTLTPVVLSRGIIHAAGPYACDHVSIRATAVATNLPPHGAFRGFGAPQSIFGLERQMDRCARAVGLSPEEFRRRNLMARGQKTATGQVIEEAIDLQAMLDQALEAAGWAERKAQYEANNADPNTTIKKGIGLATFFHGSGFTGSGEVHLASVVGVSADPDGKVHVLAASTEIGQGTNTIFSQIVAEALDVPYDCVVIDQPDTANVPDSGPTVASRTTMVVGKLVEKASRALLAKLCDAGYLQSNHTPDQFTEACRRWHADKGALEATAKYTPPPGIEWDEKTYKGSAYAAYGWAAYVASVSVDTVTMEARVDDFVAVQDIGRVLHPTLAAGQVEGGVAQAIGFALYEDVAWVRGRMMNGQMTNYIMPTAVDLPDIRVEFVEVPFEHGPSGAKGVGELPMDGPAPAIINAVEHALGVPIDTIPAVPERILAAVEAYA